MKKAETKTLVSDGVRGLVSEAKRLYLDNLNRRVQKRSFGGLPTWHVTALRNCQDILDDELCDEVKVPYGSTIAHSIQAGIHFIDIAQQEVPYELAVSCYLQWAEQFPGEPATPNEGLSEKYDGTWHLNNVNGPLAVVTANGDVVAVGDFFTAYRRLSEEGKCDSPGGTEYRRVLMEWVEDHPEDIDEFICRRANAFGCDEER